MPKSPRPDLSLLDVARGSRADNMPGDEPAAHLTGGLTAIELLESLRQVVAQRAGEAYYSGDRHGFNRGWNYGHESGAAAVMHAIDYRLSSVYRELSSRRSAPVMVKAAVTLLNELQMEIVETLEALNGPVLVEADRKVENVG